MRKDCKTRSAGRTKRILAWAVAVCCVIGSVGVVPGKAAKAAGNTQVTISADKVSIGNDDIARNYTISGKKIVTSSIENKRISGTLTTTLQEGSEDFEIKTLPSSANGTIKSSQLTFDKATQADIEGGKKLTITYQPYKLSDVTYNISQVVVLKDADHYLRSFLEISVSDQKKAQIDYIDTDRFIFPTNVKDVWGHDSNLKMEDCPAEIFSQLLGQPIYANGLFMGSEFPAADTKVDESNNKKTAQIRYYSGKTFERMKTDGQLTTDNKFVTWQSVIGAATNTDTSVVQTAFYEYIEEIATPTEFRKQYNSWYDNMLTITADSIAVSFKGTEKGLASNGMEPLDAYVVDDGWNAYYDGTYQTSTNAQTGDELNRTGFWEFNSKFPNELYTSSELAAKLQGAFGLWLGPRGGYNYPSTFGHFLEKEKTGNYNAQGGDVCVASTKYLENLEKLFIDYQDRFGVDYWKWDGFAVAACSNSSHGHMTGGTNNMYYHTDLWEKWTDLFEDVRESQAKKGKGLFINATCYVNLSPWLLQWVNTVWIQASGDTGQSGTGARHQQKIYYRDRAYWRVFVRNNLQFPLSHVFNHDPIYGVSDNSEATTDVFREYLFANAMRGTAFWEMLFSPSIMDDAKYKVVADVVSWAEKNHSILKKAKYFGDNPDSNKIYGYSCWNGNEGIVSFTNPAASEQTYTLTIDDVRGADKSLSNAKGIQVYPFADKEVEAISYGDTITVTLGAHQTVIYQYGHQDEDAPVLVSAKKTGESEITLRFDERVHPGTITVNGSSVTVVNEDDYRTLVLTLASKLTKDAKVAYSVKDVNGNKTDGEITVQNYNNGVIAKADSGVSLKNAEGINLKYDALTDVTWLSGINKKYEVSTANKLDGGTDFTISMGVKTTAADVDLMTSGDDVKLSINKDGFVEFTVKNMTVVAKENVTTVVEKAKGTFGTENYQKAQTKTDVVGAVNDGQPHSINAVREVNGMLKVYIDGELIASAYDETKVNESLTGGVITIGDDNLNGDLIGMQILDHSLGYDEVTVTETEDVDVTLSDRKGWKASACSEENKAVGDANANAAIDGKSDSWWHTNYSSNPDKCTDGHHWIAVDFGGAETFDSFVYVARDGAVNGTFKQYTFEIKDKDGKYTKVNEGEFPTSIAEHIVKLDKEYTAYGFRLTALTSTSDQAGKTFGSAVELNVGISDHIFTADELKSKTEELKKQIEAIDPSDYTGETARAYLSTVEKVENVVNASAGTWGRLEKALAETKAALVSLGDLKPALASAEAIIDGNKAYTEETLAAFESAYAEAQKAAEFATSSEAVQAVADALNAAIQGLKEDPNGGKPGTEPDDPKPPVEQKLPYKDVADNAWFKNYVNDVYQKGLMTGKSKTSFAPDENLVRAQFATILYRMEDEPKVTFSQIFNDVPNSQFYTKAVIWAAGDKVRVVTGYTNGNFGPNDNITREQMALMMYRYAKYKGYDVKDKTDISSFPDAGAVSGYAKEALEWCVAKGIISGQGASGQQKMLNPQGSTTRAECATIISRFTDTYK